MLVLVKIIWDLFFTEYLVKGEKRPKHEWKITSVDANEQFYNFPRIASLFIEIKKSTTEK